MREIKFRIIERDGYVRYATLLEIGGMLDDICTEIEHGKVSQYTGLKDVNGKEIYEDDIIKNVDPIDYGGRVEAGELFTIDFGITLGCAGLWIYSVDMDTVPIDKTQVARCVFNDDEGSEWFEVIGNRWENGDLLK